MMDWKAFFWPKKRRMGFNSYLPLVRKVLFDESILGSPRIFRVGHCCHGLQSLRNNVDTKIKNGFKQKPCLSHEFQGLRKVRPAAPKCKKDRAIDIHPFFNGFCFHQHFKVQIFPPKNAWEDVNKFHVMTRLPSGGTSPNSFFSH